MSHDYIHGRDLVLLCRVFFVCTMQPGVLIFEGFRAFRIPEPPNVVSEQLTGGSQAGRRTHHMKKIQILLISAMIGLIFSNPVLAAPDSTGLEVGQTSVMYDSSIGMPTSEANAIAQTSDGFIWIGSYSGLIRYDGSTFDRYDPSTGIASVVSLFVDSQDRLWVGTNDSGVALVNGDDVSMFSRADGVPSSSIRAIGEDGSGNILFATTQGMVYYDGTSVHEYDDHRISTEYICELRTDSRGIVYGETFDGNFFSIEGTKLKNYYIDDNLGLGDVSCIAVDDEKEGWVYLGTEGKEIIHANMDGGMKQYEIIKTPKQEHIKSIQKVGSELWICADDGIAHIDTDGKYQKLTQVDLNNSVDKMMVDYEGNLWFASSRQGIMKITNSVFANVTRIGGVYDRVCNSTLLVGDDLYIGTDTGLIVLDAKRQVKETELSKALSDARVRCLMEDSKGNIWVSTFSDHGLVRYGKDGSIREYTESEELPSNRVRLTAERANGDIVVSASGGVTVLRDDEVAAFYGEKEGLLNTEILTMAEDGDGNFYMGSDGDGLYVVDKDESLTGITSENGLKSDVILRAKWDEAHRVMWLITSNSVAYIKDGNITNIEHFPYANNFDIFFDENDNVWVLGSGGIYVVNADTLMANEDIDYVLYDSTSGLTHVTTANSHNELTEDGDLYISGTTGVSMVNINEDHDTSTDIKLNVPFIEVDDETVYLHGSDSITIPSDTNRIKIHGYALSYSLNNPRVEYFLEGFDKEPVVTSKRDLEPAVYTNLDGGIYNYQLTTVNSLTGEKEKSVSITIIKQKAIYEHWWFWPMIAVAAAVLAGLYVANRFRARAARLEQQNQKIRQMRDEVINAFAKAIDYKDQYTRGHSFRVAKYTAMLAEKLGYTGDDLNDIHNIALLHDIGKISIPDAVLNKPEALDDDEYKIMKTHAENGYEILKEIKSAPELALGAGYHHERLDGKGYPWGLKQEEIPMAAQIIAVADTFDAMYSTRPYRKKMDLSVVIERLQESAGTQLNPQVVEQMVELFKEGRLEDESVK